MADQRVRGLDLLGGVLIVVGLFALLGQRVGVGIGPLGWPVYVIGPGIFLFLVALVLGDPAGRRLATLGGALTMVGIILLYQNATDHWESWAYAWTLVVPTSLGLGRLAYGRLSPREQPISNDRQLVVWGLALFGVGVFFFEAVLGLSDFGVALVGRYLSWPILLIGMGLLLLLGQRRARHGL